MTNLLEVFKKEYEKYKEYIKLGAAILLIIFIFYITGIGCPIKYFTGVSCAGCGMSRAYFSLLRLDIKAAFHYHPLFFTPPLLLLLFINKDRVKPSTFKALLFTYVAAFVIIYLYRIILAVDDIVVFEPQNGLVYRFIIFLRRSINVLFKMWSSD